MTWATTAEGYQKKKELQGHTVSWSAYVHAYLYTLAHPPVFD